MSKKTVISKEVALTEIDKLINKFVKKPVEFDEIEETYPDILDAIMDGYLSFNKDTGVPILKLKDPIKNSEGTVTLSEVTFKTRIKPTVLRSLAKGIDLKKDPMGLQLKMVAHITDQTENMIDNYEVYDLDVIQQVSAIFS